MLFSIFVGIHVIACVLLIIAVLMQSSKGGGLSGAFGGMGSQAVMGGRETASFLSRATTYLAVTFMLTSLFLAFLLLRDLLILLLCSKPQELKAYHNLDRYYCIFLTPEEIT